jgi:hypothetical protein
VTISGTDQYYIVDVREAWRRKPYVTVWRPKDAGYAFPLPWAGKYTREQIEAHPNYYYTLRYGSTRILERYPVACEVVGQLGIAPARGVIDGDIGPVIPNSAQVRKVLRRHRYVPRALATPPSPALNEELSDG